MESREELPNRVSPTSVKKYGECVKTLIYALKQSMTVSEPIVLNRELFYNFCEKFLHQIS
jgi:hypothetical protein